MGAEAGRVEEVGSGEPCSGKGVALGPLPASVSHFPLGRILVVVLRGKADEMCVVNCEVSWSMGFLHAVGHLVA